MAARERYAHGEFCWVDLASTSVLEAAAFYRGLLGWDLTRADDEDYGLFTSKGVAVAGLGELSDEDLRAGMPPVWNAYVSVGDIDAAVARVVELGGAVVVPVSHAGAQGRLAFCADPTGATFGLWEPAAHHGSGLVKEPGAPCWHELATPDIAAASAFYAALFGWTFEDQPMFPAKYLMIRAAGRADADGGGMLEMNEHWEGVPPHWMVYLAVADADAAVAYGAAHGGQVGVPPFDTPVGRISVLCDPQGAVFSVIQRA